MSHMRLLKTLPNMLSWDSRFFTESATRFGMTSLGGLWAGYDVIPNRSGGAVRKLLCRLPSPGVAGSRAAVKYGMPSFPIKTCVECGEQFELKPGKPGYANRCPDCSEEDAGSAEQAGDQWKSDKGANAARREAMKNLLYRKDS